MKEKRSIKERYEEEAKQRKLPPYDGLDHEFDLASIEEAHEPVRAVCKQIGETFEQYAKILEGILQADSLTSMHEATYFSDQEREEIVTLMKRLMLGYREWQINELEKNIDGYARYLNETSESWGEIKRSLLTVLQKLRDSWNHREEFRPDVEYLG